MIVVNLLFYLFSFIMIASAFMVILSRNPVHSVLFPNFVLFQFRRDISDTWRRIFSFHTGHSLRWGCCGPLPICGDDA